MLNNQQQAGWSNFYFKQQQVKGLGFLLTISRARAIPGPFEHGTELPLMGWAGLPLT
jgi:hypothetical protein